MRLLDLTNERFSRLLVLQRDSSNTTNGKPQWICQCDCGQVRVISGNSLRRGLTQSCGCLRKEHLRKIITKHGLRYTPEYDAFYKAKGRCENPNHCKYSDYGGRGIEFRFQSVQEFVKELGHRPTAHHSIDRIDNNGHYETGNVRWATAKEQANNKRNNHIVEYQSQTLTVAQVIELSGYSHGHIHRLLRHNQTLPPPKSA